MAAGIIRFSDFTGGEASIYPLANMNPKYSVKLQNCHVSESGAIAKMPGYIALNSASCGAKLASGFEFLKTDGTSVLLAGGGGSIWKLEGSSLIAKKTGLDASAKIRFSSFGDVCIACNGVDVALKSTDGNTWTALGGTPPATTFKTHVHKGRVWFIERANKLLASHSALNNPEAQEGYVDFKYVLKEGDELVDIFTYIDLLVFVFKNHIAIYSGQAPSGANADFGLVQLIKGVGAINTDVSVPIGSDAAFVHIIGVKTLRQVVTTGSLNIGDVSDKIDPVLRNEIESAGVFAAGHYAQKGWVFLLLGNIVRIYDYAHKAWARMQGADVRGMFNTSDGRLILTGSGFLYEYGQGWTFAGVEPYMEWQTAWIPLSKGNKVSPKLIDISIKSGDVVKVDLSTAFDLSPAMTENQRQFTNEQVLSPLYIDDIPDYDGWSPIAPYSYTNVRMPLFGRGRIMQIIMRNSSDKPLEVSDMTIQTVAGGF